MIGIGVRWPLLKATVTLVESDSIKDTKKLIIQQTNIKSVEINKGQFSVELDTQMTPILEQEGFMREIGRRMQALRKKSGLKKNDRIKMIVETEFKLEQKFKDDLKEKVGADLLDFVVKTNIVSEFMDEADIKGKKFKFVLEKI